MFIDYLNISDSQYSSFNLLPVVWSDFSANLYMPERVLDIPAVINIFHYR